MSGDKQSFQGAIEKSKSWSQVRFSQVEAAHLVAHCHAVLRSPGQHIALAKLWDNYVDVVQPKIKERLESNDWSESHGQTLILFSIASLNMRNGIRNYLPEPFAHTLRDEDKEALWAWYLLNQGIFVKPENPYCLLEPSTMLFMGGPYAAVEIEQRAKTDPYSFNAGMILYNWASEDSKVPGAEELTIGAIKNLARAAKKHIPLGMMGSRPVRNASGLDSRLEPVELQVAETLHKEFFHGTAEEMFAKALDGLGYVPIRAAHDFIDEERANIPKPIAHLLREASEVERRAKQQCREYTSEESRRLNDISEEIQNINRQIDQTGMNPDFAIEEIKPEDLVLEKETIALLAEFEAKFPKEWALIQSVKIRDIPEKDVALSEGVTPSAITQRLNRALNVLREFLSR